MVWRKTVEEANAKNMVYVFALAKTARALIMALGVT